MLSQFTLSSEEPLIGGDPSSSSRMSPSRSPADSAVAIVNDDAAATSALPSINNCPASPIQVALRSLIGMGMNSTIVLSDNTASSLLAFGFDATAVHSGG